MGSLHLTIDALAQAFSNGFGVLADKIKVKTIELFELCSECLKLASLVWNVRLHENERDVCAYLLPHPQVEHPCGMGVRPFLSFLSSQR